MDIAELIQNIENAKSRIAVMDALLEHTRKHIPDDTGYVELSMQPDGMNGSEAPAAVIEEVYDDLLELRGKYEQQFDQLRKHEVKSGKKPGITIRKA